MPKKIWITWERQRRSVELSKAFDSKIYILAQSSSDIPIRLIRYIVLGLKTAKLVFIKKPDLIFAQNPSIMLALELCILKKILYYKIVIDRHSNFKFQYSKGLIWKLFHLISDYTLKQADLTIVTNLYLKNFVLKKGGNAFVLPDKLPCLKPGNTLKLKGKINIVVPSSFNADEPIIEIIKAAQKISKDICIYFTGDFKKLKNKTDTLETSSNIIYTGFLPEDEYQSLLFSADIIMALTTQDYTLNCAAYEAVVLEKPLILSKFTSIMRYFSKGAIYCNADQMSIHYAIMEAIQRRKELVIEQKYMKNFINKRWQTTFKELKAHTISNLSS